MIDSDGHGARHSFLNPRCRLGRYTASGPFVCIGESAGACLKPTDVSELPAQNLFQQHRSASELAACPQRVRFIEEAEIGSGALAIVQRPG